MNNEQIDTMIIKNRAEELIETIENSDLHESQTNVIYTKYESDNGNYYVDHNNPYCASWVYYDRNDGKHSNGMGGSTFAFKLANGDVDTIQGPWNTNTDALFKHTGVDLRDKHMMRYIISNNPIVGDRCMYAREYTTDDMIEMVDDPEPMNFYYPKERAKYWADKLNKSVYLYWGSLGGSSNGMIKPSEDK